MCAQYLIVHVMLVSAFTLLLIPTAPRSAGSRPSQSRGGEVGLCSITFHVLHKHLIGYI